MSKLNNYVVKVKQTSLYLIEAETSEEAKRHVDWLYSRLDIDADKYTVEIKTAEVPEGGLDEPDPMDDQEEVREQLIDLIDEDRTFLVKDNSDGQVFWWTLTEILQEINRDRSDDWTPYDASDWCEGWDQWVDGYTIEKEYDQCQT